MNPVIMVVEDENLLLQAITRKLEKNNITPILCTSGKAALDKLRASTSLPDAIWLDYNLGDINGLEVIKQIKNNPAWNKIVVVVVSNSASDDKIEQALNAGASQYIVKAENRLDDIIQTILSLTRSKNI